MPRCAQGANDDQIPNASQTHLFDRKFREIISPRLVKDKPCDCAVTRWSHFLWLDFSVYAQPGLQSVRTRPVRYQKPTIPQDMNIKPACTLVRSRMLTDMGDSDTWMHIYII